MALFGEAAMGNSLRAKIRAKIKSSPAPLRRALRAVLIPPLRAYVRCASTGFGKNTLWKYLLSHLAWLERSVVARTFFGSEMRVDAEDIVGRYIYYFGIWEPNLTNWIRERLVPGDVFIDVGANIGYYSMLASQLVGDSGRVVAIEAAPQTFSMLSGNVERNHLLNVRSVNVAAWHCEESLQIFAKPGHSGMTTVIPERADRWNLKPSCAVRGVPLSKLLSSEEMKAARLIKIDVEGAEWHVIMGLRPSLEGCRHDLEIVIEIAPEMLGAKGKSCEDFLGLFRQMGFHPYYIENDYSAAAYLSWQPSSRPKRIDRIPTLTYQSDLIFSRVDAPEL
jgi:FkbM family methyltransferase